jgi:prephenate dehydratase
VTGTSAAICSALAADVFGLDLLADGIEGEDQNETRFLVIKNGDSTNPKTSLACLIKGLAVLKTHINFPIKPTQDALADAGLGQVKIYTRNSEQMWIYFLFDNVHGEESSFDKLRGKTSEAEWYNWGTWTVNRGNVL